MIKPLGKQLARAALKRLVERVLHQSTPPDTSRAEHDFDKMQRRTKPRDMSCYAYDDLAIWKRATDRSKELLSLPKMSERGKHVLEIGCGDGMVGTLLSTYGHEVLLADMEDWRHVSAKSTHFVECLLEQGLPVDDDQFDLAFSYNTFEHVLDPTACLRELMRVTKAGGLIYLFFSPLYNSPWGLHAYRTLHMPYPQFLFSDDFLQNIIRTVGVIDLGKQRDELQPLNRWSADAFSKLWEKSGCKMIRYREWHSFREAWWILRYADSFRGRNLNWKEVTTEGMELCLQNTR